VAVIAPAELLQPNLKELLERFRGRKPADEDDFLPVMLACAIEFDGAA
jgi:hypothetical protein